MRTVAESQAFVERVKPVLDGLIRRRLTLEQIVDVVSGVLGRKIRVVVWPPLAKSRTTGAWLDDEGEDVILVIPTRSWVHHCQIVLHELAHMLMVHAGIEPLGKTVEFVVPGEFKGRIRACRGMRETAIELAAEDIADSLLESSAVPEGAAVFAREFG